MVAELENLLERAAQESTLANAALGRGESPLARQHLLQAAELLFLAARSSQGRLRENRLQIAEGLLAQAEMLKRSPVSVTRVLQPPPAAQATRLGDDEQAKTWLVSERPDIRFEDIAGLEEVKEQIRLKLLYPFTHPELAAQYGIHAGGGLLLYGPPGTGKTMIARAVAGEIESAFFAIKPSEVMSQWVGVAEQNVARLFAEASAYPISVIFIDEMEALAPRRRANQSTVMARVVPQILAELDGFEKRANPLLLIGATNEPWALDAAVVRPGRLDRLIYIPPPDAAARRRILELNLRQAPLSAEVALDMLAAQTERFSGADMAALAQRARERAFRDAIATGVACPIQVADFDAVLAEMHPSIPPDDLRMFEQFAASGHVTRR
ncbi:MAG: ATP-binding protein [Anaerolineales bacterium]|jgi:transitional endoplasmic reticulum ATPase|nr:ATP-binding protein [Anaerolineales bacterium]